MMGMAEEEAQGAWSASSGRSKSVRSPSWTCWMTLAMNHVAEIWERQRPDVRDGFNQVWGEGRKE